MAVTILFNAMTLFSRFCLWRIDAAREKLETALKELVNPRLTHAQMRAVPADRVMAAPEQRAAPNRSLTTGGVARPLSTPGELHCHPAGR
jgi:hypothetical protein